MKCRPRLSARCVFHTQRAGSDRRCAVRDQRERRRVHTVRATFAFARKLTSAPHTIVDEDVAELRKLFSDNEVRDHLSDLRRQYV